MQLVNSSDTQVSIVEPHFSSELSSIISSKELAGIEMKCQKIDTETNNMTLSILAIGRYLTEIANEIRNSCKMANVEFTPIFESFLQTRFNRKTGWAYRHIQIFNRFGEEDPLLGQLPINNLSRLCKLSDDQIEQVKTHIANSPQRLTRNQIDELIQSVAPKAVVTIENDGMDEELAEYSFQKQQMEKSLKNLQDERDLLSAELDKKTQTNNDLILRLQQEQESTKNVAATLTKEREQLLELQKKINEEKKQAAKKSDKPTEHFNLVETDKIPDGFTSIEEAIADADNRLKAKQKELADIAERLAQQNSILLKTEAVQNELEELHELYTTLQLKQLSILNKAKPSDLKQSKSLIEKISTIALDLNSNLKLHAA